MLPTRGEGGQPAMTVPASPTSLSASRIVKATAPRSVTGMAKRASAAKKDPPRHRRTRHRARARSGREGRATNGVRATGERRRSRSARAGGSPSGPRPCRRASSRATTDEDEPDDAGPHDRRAPARARAGDAAISPGVHVPAEDDHAEPSATDERGRGSRGSESLSTAGVTTTRSPPA